MVLAMVVAFILIWSPYAISVAIAIIQVRQLIIGAANAAKVIVTLLRTNISKVIGSISNHARNFLTLDCKKNYGGSLSQDNSNLHRSLTPMARLL